MSPHTDADIDNYAITLAQPNPSQFVVSNISVDCTIFGFEDSKLKLLLIQHGRGPMQSQWALPGDYLAKEMDLDTMAVEVLRRLTGLNDVFVEQLGAFGDLNRVDYRRVITISYYALISPRKFELKIGEGASNVAWFDIDQIPSLILIII